MAKEKVANGLAWALLGLLLAQTVHFAVTKGNTYDEVIDIAAGYSYLRTGDYHLCPEHPALGTTITALPLLFLDLPDPTEDPLWSADTRWEYAKGLLHQSPSSPETILFFARLPSILLAAIGACLLYRFGGKELGPWGGVISLALLATSPTFLAHSSLATTDSLVAVFILLSVLALIRCFDEITWPRVVLAGLAIGAALATKMTALILLPGAVVIALASRHEKIHLRALAIATIFAVALASLWTVYAWRATADETLLFREDPGNLQAPGVAFFGIFVPHEYAYGVREMMHSARQGWPAFLLGERYTDAPWWAYPLAGVIKTREAVLFALLLALIFWKRVGGEWRRLLQILAVPSLLLLALVPGKGYHGVRILLPMGPLVFLVIGGTAARWASRGRRPAIGVTVVTVLTGLSGLLANPDLLAYQNSFSGGRETDHHRLVDTDLDWGQDLPALSRALQEMGNPPIHLRYFGTGDPTRYPIHFRVLTECEPVRGNIAISATSLQGLYLDDPDCYAWLRPVPPIARAGRSILIYRIP